MQTIIDADADVVCLQEFYSDNTEAFNMLQKLEVIYPFSHVEVTYSTKGSDKWGIATFSKFPIRRKEAIRFPDALHNLAICSDIFAHDKMVKVYNCHLQSIHLSLEDLESLEQIYDTIKWGAVDNIFTKLKYSFIRRAGQADKLKSHIREAAHPVILCGDFNETPNSYTYRTLSKNMRDSFVEAGFGIGATFSGKIPGLRIDYILYDKKFSAKKHTIFDNPYSDHYAIAADLVWE